MSLRATKQLKGHRTDYGMVTIPGFLSTVISDVEMRDIAKQEAERAVTLLAEQDHPVMTGLQADLAELRQHVVSQVECRACCTARVCDVASPLCVCCQLDSTVAAIESTSRKASSEGEQLQAQLTAMVQEAEERLNNTDHELAERISGLETHATELSQYVAEAAPPTGLSELSAAATEGAEKVQQLEHRVTELEASIAAERAGQDAAWEQTQQLADAFNTGAALPAVENIGSFSQRHRPQEASSGAQAARSRPPSVSTAPTTGAGAGVGAGGGRASNDAAQYDDSFGGPQRIVSPIDPRVESRLSAKSRTGTPESQASTLKYSAGPIEPPSVF